MSPVQLLKNQELNFAFRRYHVFNIADSVEENFTLFALQNYIYMEYLSILDIKFDAAGSR